MLRLLLEWHPQSWWSLHPRLIQEKHIKLCFSNLVHERLGWIKPHPAIVGSSCWIIFASACLALGDLLLQLLFGSSVCRRKNHILYGLIPFITSISLVIPYYRSVGWDHSGVSRIFVGSIVPCWTIGGTVSVLPKPFAPRSVEPRVSTPSTWKLCRAQLSHWPQDRNNSSEVSINDTNTCVDLVF